jgi:hypothetical protein
VLVQALSETSSAPSIASRFTSLTGLFYVAMGLTICAAPFLIPVVFFEPAFMGREAGIFRLVGWVMAVVGWLLWSGGRTGARSFVAAGIAARLAVPLVVVPLALAGVLPHMMYVFGLLDPVSALVTWRLMSRK